MINFIVCDDNSDVVKKVSGILSKIMLPTDIEYSIIEFTKFNNEFKTIMNSNVAKKIYILDVDVHGISGIDISRKIREKDWDSIIILISAYYEHSYTAFRNRLLILDFIPKFDNFDKKLIECIKLSLNIFENKTSLSLTINNSLVKIDYNDILYIVKDEEKRKTIINTAYKKYETTMSLVKVEEKLNADFIRTHRACIVNKNNIKTIDCKENKIIFKNKEYTFLLSRKKKKEVKELCG